MKKSLRSYATLPRIPLVSHIKAATNIPLADYNAAHFLAWGENIGKYLFRPRHPFKTYQPVSVSRSANDTGVYFLPDISTIALAGDWATGTEEAARVANQINLAKADYNIHLGDVYYVGGIAEVNENFLGVKTSSWDPVRWPKALIRSFALLGNHDMYADGSGYFDVLLPSLGQEASYFCIENEHWRIVGLDTGYNSGGIEIDSIIKPSCKIPEEVLDWLFLRSLKSDDRGIIFLSHHGPISAFERAYPEAAKQLSPFLNRMCLWFWGHEHRMAVYDVATVSGLKFGGHCLGHGGMPVKLKHPRDTPRSVFSDIRNYPNSQGLHVGYNGYALLKFSGENLTVNYQDLNGNLVYVESWTKKGLK